MTNHSDEEVENFTKKGQYRLRQHSTGKFNDKMSFKQDQTEVAIEHSTREMKEHKDGYKLKMLLLYTTSYTGWSLENETKLILRTSKHL